MAASDTVIAELDAGSVSRNIKVRDDGTGVLTPYAALLFNDAPVTTAAPLGITSTQLTAILSALNVAGATSQAKAIDSLAGSTDIVVPGALVRRDTLATVTPGVGDYMPPLGGQYGEMHVGLATALGGSVDSVQAMAVPDVAAFVHKSARYTTAQTGTDLWTAATGKIPVVTQLRVTWAGSTDGIITVWISTSSAADTTFSAGTDYALLDTTVQPSTKGSGGVIIPCWFTGPVTPTANRVKVTTSAAITCTVMVDGYEKTP